MVIDFFSAEGWGSERGDKKTLCGHTRLREKTPTTLSPNVDASPEPSGFQKEKPYIKFRFLQNQQTSDDDFTVISQRLSFSDVRILSKMGSVVKWTV